MDLHLDQADLLIDLRSDSNQVPWLNATNCPRIEISDLPDGADLNELALLSLTSRWFRSEFLDHARIPPAHKDVICLYGEAEQVSEVILEIGRYAAVENLEVLLLAVDSEVKVPERHHLETFGILPIRQNAETTPESLIAECRVAKVVVATHEQPLIIAQSFGTPTLRISDEMTRTEAHRLLRETMKSDGDSYFRWERPADECIDLIVNSILEKLSDSPNIEQDLEGSADVALARVEAEVLKERALLEREAFYRSLAAKQLLIDELVSERDQAVKQQEKMMSAQRVQVEHLNELEMALSTRNSSSERQMVRGIPRSGLMGLVRRIKSRLVGRNIQ
jgi:hypothetical protein